MLSEHLKKYRTEQRFTKQELSRQSGVNAYTIALLESGKLLNPKLNTVLAICEVLNVPIQKLIK